MTTVQIDQALADSMVDKAIVYCADKKLNGNVQEATLALRQGRCDLCSYFTESLVRQVCQYLGEMDRMVRAIYRVEPESVFPCPQGAGRFDAPPRRDQPDRLGRSEERGAESAKRDPGVGADAEPPAGELQEYIFRLPDPGRADDRQPRYPGMARLRHAGQQRVCTLDPDVGSRPGALVGIREAAERT
jgi:hypothetical protein